MTGRVRRINPSTPVGSYHQEFFGIPDDTFVSSVLTDATCIDSTGNLPAAGLLDIDKIDRSSYTPLTGRNNFGSFGFQELRSVMPTGLRDFTPPLFVDDGDMSGFGSTLLARTNPSRPVVSIPTYIGELRDAPELIRLTGKSLLKKGASTYLNWQFGWEPLISDLRKMVDFQSHVEKRMKEIQSLTKKGGLHRRISIDEGSIEGPEESVSIDGVYAAVNATRQTITTWKTWGTVNWLQDPEVKLPQSSAEMLALARRSVYGLSLDPGSIATDAWNLLPWSWLVDWFTNAGDFISSFDNTVPAVPFNPCIMKEIKSTTTFKRTNSNWISGGDASITRTLKLRRLGDATLAANLPFLSGRQLSILGSLAITRSR
jgi:hypothetical protein